jgi:hypothetical protein
LLFVAGRPTVHAPEYNRLTKYNLQEQTVGSAPAIEQWAFFFLFADRYEPEAALQQRLRSRES